MEFVKVINFETVINEKLTVSHMILLWVNQRSISFFFSFLFFFPLDHDKIVCKSDDKLEISTKPIGYNNIVCLLYGIEESVCKLISGKLINR